MPCSTTYKSSVSVYLPYGEDWVEQNFFQPHDTTRLGIYRFNGKEKDYESGFHYYGARYYWSETLTGWLSVDPMADKYPSLSPYNYCAWNPILFVDPDGRDIDIPPYTIQKGDTFWDLENQWDLPHGTLQEINPNVDSHKLQVGQEINAAKRDGNLVIVGNNTPIPEGREFERPYEEESIGMETYCSSDDWTPFRMAFDALLPSMGSFLPSNSLRFNRGMTNVEKILARAKSGKGNFGLGKGTYADAIEAGKKWVGKGYRTSSKNKNILISSDGKRQFRMPSHKPRHGKYQANFESRESFKGEFKNDGHLDIID